MPSLEQSREKPQIRSRPPRRAFIGGGLGAYQGIIESLWKTGAHEQAFDYGERVRSRVLLDMLGTKVQLTRMKGQSAGDSIGFAELSDREDNEEAYRFFVDKVRSIDPEQASLMTVEPLTLKQVQALLEPRQSYLSIW